jgi:hypothetical protein
MSKLSPTAIQAIRNAFKEVQKASDVRYSSIGDDDDLVEAMHHVMSNDKVSLVAALIIHEGLIAVADAINRGNE